MKFCTPLSASAALAAATVFAIFVLLPLSTAGADDAPPAENKIVSGSVVSVDLAAKTITLADNKGAPTAYPLDPTATITLLGTASTLGALPIGYTAELKVSPDGKALQVAARLPAVYRQEPSPYPLPDAWYLTFKHAVPKRIVVDVPGLKAPTAYWYLTYTVTNNTGKEQEYYPEFEMVSQDGKVHRSDRHILAPVFDAIKKSENNPLLLPLSQMIGTLHQGEDQAKDGVAIWEEPMARMGAFSIYAAGLNSEFVIAADKQGHPILDQNKATITLRKTLEMNYVIWGDEIKPGEDPVQTKPQRWLMR